MTFPSNNPLKVLQQLDYDEALLPTDARFVNTDVARGAQDLRNRLLRKFGLNHITGEFFPNASRHALLFGPIGGGKSTELRRLYEDLRKPGQPTSGKIYPVLLNVRGEIDINNLRYADMLLALSYAVVKALDEASPRIVLPAAKVQALTQWFTEHVLSHDSIKELSAQIGTEAEAGAGWPFLLKLSAKFASVFKNSSIYKDSLRDVVQKTFTQFADAFNALVSAAEEQLKANGLGERLLLIVDGTDKIQLEDAQKLFVYDTEQLLCIQALILYTAPITLKYSGTTHSKLDSELVLPIIKLYDREGKPFEPGRTAMRHMLDQRIAYSTFTDPSLRDQLIDASGGHPRELLRLLGLSCELTETNQIDADTVRRAIDRLAAEYRYWLEPEDFKLLVQVDVAQGQHSGNDERARGLLWRLALLQYNDGSWRRSHPVVRTLEGYGLAQEAYAKAQPTVLQTITGLMRTANPPNP